MLTSVNTCCASAEAYSRPGHLPPWPGSGRAGRSGRRAGSPPTRRSGPCRCRRQRRPRGPWPPGWPRPGPLPAPAEMEDPATCPLTEAIAARSRSPLEMVRAVTSLTPASSSGSGCCRRRPIRARSPLAVFTGRSRRQVRGQPPGTLPRAAAAPAAPARASPRLARPVATALSVSRRLDPPKPAPHPQRYPTLSGPSRTPARRPHPLPSGASDEPPRGRSRQSRPESDRHQSGIRKLVGCRRSPRPGRFAREAIHQYPDVGRRAAEHQPRARLTGRSGKRLRGYCWPARFRSSDRITQGMVERHQRAVVLREECHRDRLCAASACPSARATSPATPASAALRRWLSPAEQADRADLVAQRDVHTGRARA